MNIQNFRELFATRVLPGLRLTRLPPEPIYGLVEVAPEKLDYVQGGDAQALKMILSPERDHTSSLPVFESQIKGFDSYSCVTFSALNNIEILYKKLFGVDVNFSDRYISSMSDTIPGSGNSLKKVADTIRKYGLVLEEEYPWGGSDGPEYVKKPGQNVVDKGKIWLRAFEVQYEWVGWAGCKPEALYDALQYGPLQVTVNGQAARTNSISMETNHAVTIYKSVWKKSFSIFDHYLNCQYDVSWGFYFGSAMQFSLLKKKYIPLVMIYGKPEIYAVFGGTACHIADEKTWNYGTEINLWEKDPVVYTERTFREAYLLGKAIIFK